MSEPETAPEALRWLRYAREDLGIAHRLTDDAPPRYACWFAQQAAEKALKAALVLEGLGVPLTHDLRAIRNRLPSEWPTGPAQEALALLTVWGSQSRYPEDWPEPAPADATRAAAEARAIYEYVAAEFRRRGVAVE